MNTKSSNVVEAVDSRLAGFALRAVVGDKRSRLVELAVQKNIPEERVDTAIKALTGEKQEPFAEPYFSIKQAQAYSTLSRITLYEYRRKDKLKFFRIGGRILIRRVDLDNLIQSGSAKINYNASKEAANGII